VTLRTLGACAGLAWIHGLTQDDWQYLAACHAGCIAAKTTAAGQEMPAGTPGRS
jgi:hypothetical protein